MEIIKQLVETTFEEITTEEWLSRVNHIKKVEEDYIRLEPQIDEMTEHIVINLQDDSDSDSSMSESGSDDDNGDFNLSGIEALPHTQIQLTDNSDSGKLCGAAAVSPSPLLTASPTPYDTTPLSRFSGPVWNLSMYKSECSIFVHNQ
ncbi:hypothetical protein J6590_049970 [Homalodisca vitripennis]|nr:hypothetical protein J6590_049970 [Homalodisca vitripennis]